MLMSYKRGQTSVVLRVKILDSSVTTGAGKTGLSSASSGLIISTIADNEASATAYTVAGSTIESITTIGTYATPTATKCRFREVDSTNHKGVYEIQIADARFAVSSAKSLIVSISGATNAAETDVVIPLQDMDPYDAVRGGMTALPNANANANGGLPILSSSGTTLAYTVSTLTTYTGNMPQTGDSYARIGAAGAGLTAIPDSAGTTTLLGRVPAFPTNFSSLSIDTNGRTKVQAGIPKNTALPGFQFYMALSSDHQSPATGASVTAVRSIDGAAFASCFATPVELGSGWYKIDLAATDLNGELIALSFSATSCDTTLVTLVTQP